jgi:hypothetical protein
MDLSTRKANQKILEKCNISLKICFSVLILRFKKLKSEKAS